MVQRNYGVRDASDQAIATILTCSMMPPEIASEHTQETHTIGAIIMLNHLVYGEWDLTLEQAAPLMQEFLGRVIANAQRQGIAIPTTLVEDPRT